jgi:hypothetical protein
MPYSQAVIRPFKSRGLKALWEQDGRSKVDAPSPTASFAA